MKHVQLGITLTVATAFLIAIPALLDAPRALGGFVALALALSMGSMIGFAQSADSAKISDLLVMRVNLKRMSCIAALDKLRQQDQRRLVDRQVDMFKHQDVSVDPGLMTRSILFQNEFKLSLVAGASRNGRR